MNRISTTYTLKYRFIKHNHIQVTSCGKVFNIKTGRKKKMCYNGGSIGLWLTSKDFILKSRLNQLLEPIPKHEYLEDNFLNEF